MQGYTHNTGTIIGKGGIELFFQNWVVDSPRGVLVIAHGLGEHSGRYSNLIGALAEKGYPSMRSTTAGTENPRGKRAVISTASWITITTSKFS
jgi:hypothetical protein